MERIHTRELSALLSKGYTVKVSPIPTGFRSVVLDQHSDPVGHGYSALVGRSISRAILNYQTNGGGGLGYLDTEAQPGMLEHRLAWLGQDFLVLACGGKTELWFMDYEGGEEIDTSLPALGGPTLDDILAQIAPTPSGSHR